MQLPLLLAEMQAKRKKAESKINTSNPQGTFYFMHKLQIYVLPLSAP